MKTFSAAILTLNFGSTLTSQKLTVKSGTDAKHHGNLTCTCREIATSTTNEPTNQHARDRIPHALNPEP